MLTERGTVDREYLAGSKVARAKYSMRFNFVNLQNYFNLEILIHGVEGSVTKQNRKFQAKFP